MYENILEVENLSKKYEKFELNHINISVPKGTIMGLIGENGAGKTTTIKLILNQVKRDCGEIQIFGKDNIRDQYDVKEDIGIVFAESTFYDELHPSQVGKIMSGLYRNWDNNKFKSYMESFELPEQKIKKYSTGMHMKLNIVIALSHSPKLLLLDEATSGLDPVVRGEVLQLLREFIQDEDNGVLFSSHITSDLEKVADYITYLHDGNIIFSEEKDVILEKYGILKCPKNVSPSIESSLITTKREGEYSDEYLINDKDKAIAKGLLSEEFIMDNANLEDIMTFHKSNSKVALI